MLYQLSQILGARNLDRDELLRTILDGAIKLTKAERGFIMLYTPERKLSVEMARDMDGQPVPESDFDFSRTITRRVLETQELMHIPRIAPDSHLAQTHSVARMKLTSIMCAPMKILVRGKEPSGRPERRHSTSWGIHRVLGVIYLDSSADDRAFSVEDLRVFEALANHATSVLSNFQFYEEATKDQLTQLFNRRQFHILVEDERQITEHLGSPFCVAVFDVDRFSDYNARFGRLAGDNLLREVGRRLEDKLRQIDVACRYGADKFAVLLTDTDGTGGAEVLSRLNQALSSVDAATPGFRISLAAGVATYQKGGVSTEALLAQADQALAAAKQEGADPVIFWTPGLEQIGAGADKLSGILTGDWATDYRNVLALLDAIRAVNARTELSTLVERALDLAIGIVGADRGFIFIREAPEGMPDQIARSHDRQPISVLPLDEGLARQAAESARVLRLGGAGEPARMAAPLLIGSRSIGAVMAERSGPNALPFSENEATYFLALTREIASAIENGVLWDQTQRDRQQIELLNKQLALKVEAQTVELAEAKRQLETRYRYDRLVGRSEPMRRVFNVMDKVTPSDLAVLIQGESGTGKELVAKMIHYNGPRADQRFLSENCAAISPALLESELFGHVKGAFTGATSDKIGLFEHASGGTLFLDEIGDLEFDLQAKLLRVLEAGSIRPVGSQQERSVDVRILAASNKDLRVLRETGKFREDLYYRLAVVTIALPPLRDRLDDLPHLVESLLAEYAASKGVPVSSLTPDAMQLLSQHKWPGNVRELRNMLERLSVFTAGEVISAEDVSAQLMPEMVPETESGLHAQLRSMPLKEAKKAFERDYLARALENTDRNISRTASEIGVDRRYLYDLLDKHGLR